MAEFYRFPQWILTALVMIVAVCIALQTLAISYSFRRLPAGWARKVENGMECAVLAALFFFAALLGQVQYGLYGSFLLPSAYGNARQVVFLLGAVLGATAAVGTELIWPFFVIGGMAVLLPLTEAITGAAYPFFFLAALLYFLVRSVHICLLRRRELYTQISSISIKEAIDTLHTGLLFFRQSGEPLLCNRRMDALARQLTGQPLRSGLEFQRHLESGELQCGCVREVLGDQQVFRLSDASVWSISAHAIPMGRRTCILLTADDVTAHWDAVTLLARQNETLKKRGQELRHTIEHLQAICEAEEIARKITDALGGYGIFGVELFVQGDRVLFSEVSPRPHDTGMVTMISQDLSEFALHVRAILGLPIPNIAFHGPSASRAVVVEGDTNRVELANLEEVLSEPDTQIRIFGKSEVEGHRRMAVLLARGASIEEAREKTARAYAKLKINLFERE